MAISYLGTLRLLLGARTEGLIYFINEKYTLAVRSSNDIRASCRIIYETGGQLIVCLGKIRL